MLASGLMAALALACAAAVWTTMPRPAHARPEQVNRQDFRFAASDRVKPELRIAIVIPPRANLPGVPSVFETERLLSNSALLNRWQPDIVKASARFRVPQTWIRAVIEAESGGRTMMGENQPITSDKGAMGLMQLMPKTYGDMSAQYGLGRNPYEPRDNILAGAAYLRWLYQKYGYPEMFAAYNDGPGNLEQRLIDGRLLPLETQIYVGEVTGTLARGRIGGLGLRGGGPKVRFTRPNGAPVFVDTYAVNAVRAPVADEYPTDVRAVISIGRLQQGVTETVAEVAAAIRKHGGRV